MLAVMYVGQGRQEKGMGAEVFGRYPGLVEFASDVLGYDLVRLCTEDPDDLLARTEYTQPALFVVNALRTFERAHREEPKAGCYLGHSLGEYNALLAAGVFDFAAGLRMVKLRGELMAKASAGGMTAVMHTPAEQILAALAEDGVDGIDIAGYNTATQVVVAGTPDLIDRAHETFRSRKILFTPLKVSAPFHSRYMEPARREFAAFLENFRFAEPDTPVISNVTGEPHQPGRTAQLLADQLVAPVRWTDSIQNLLARQEEVEFAEIGGGALTRMVQKIKAGE